LAAITRPTTGRAMQNAALECNSLRAAENRPDSPISDVLSGNQPETGARTVLTSRTAISQEIAWTGWSAYPAAIRCRFPNRPPWRIPIAHRPDPPALPAEPARSDPFTPRCAGVVPAETD